MKSEALKSLAQDVLDSVVAEQGRIKLDYYTDYVRRYRQSPMRKATQAVNWLLRSVGVNFRFNEEPLTLAGFVTMVNGRSLVYTPWDVGWEALGIAKRAMRACAYSDSVTVDSYDLEVFSRWLPRD